MGARIFLVAKPFCGYQHVFYSVTLTLESYFFLTLTFALANNLWTLSARALIFHMNILWDKAFSWKQIIWPCDLDIRVWPTFSKLYLANNFWIVSGRALIFHMNIPCDEIFLLVLNHLTLTFDQLKYKELTDIGHNLYFSLWSILAFFWIVHYRGHCVSQGSAFGSKFLCLQQINDLEYEKHTCI